ncbi:hypothetical protein ACIA7S_28295 [Streptomyces sp. NPDC051643]|uniref:hypothetical protein n=1 Tax=Streptomyces sp. NPDC051643 TaxID=3365665 RepID=UPI003798D4FE
MPTPDEDGFTELIDAQISRVDLVDKAANGLPILMAKAEGGAPAGLMDPDLIRDLIGKSAEPAPAGESVLTMSGSPGALAQFITQAGARPADASITKDADMPDLDPTVVLAAPDEKAPGIPTTPGSPAWEAIDAATARKWTAILSRAKAALLVMEEREALESATGEVGAYDNALDLNNAACAVDYAISVLAPFAVDEQAEVDAGVAEVGKALAEFDSTSLDVIESLTHVAKAGRALSAANERAIRSAAESLQKVLASLPAAPDPQESGQPVAKKETSMSQENTPEVAPAVDEGLAAGIAPVAKAEGDEGKPAMVAVYDAKGKLVGIVSPDEITPISGADANDETPTAEEAPAAADDLTPAPAAAVGVPTDEDGVAKEAATVDTPQTTPNPGTDDILKGSDLRDLIKGMLDEHSATQAAQLTKTGEAVVELAGVVETLKGQLTALEEQPAVPGVFANGATPPAHMLRGQDQGAAAQSIDMAKARELKNTLTFGTAREQNDAALEMQRGAIAALAALHRG